MTSVRFFRLTERTFHRCFTPGVLSVSKEDDCLASGYRDFNALRAKSTASYNLVPRSFGPGRHLINRRA